MEFELCILLHFRPAIDTHPPLVSIAGDKVQFALSAAGNAEMETLAKDEIKHTLAFATEIFSANPNIPHFQKQLDAAVARLHKRVKKPRGGRQFEVAIQAFRTFCANDSFVSKQCFGHQQQATAGEYSSRQRVNTAMLTADPYSQQQQQQQQPRPVRTGSPFNATKGR